MGWNHHLDDYIHGVYSAGTNRERVRTIICLLLINMNIAPETLWKMGSGLHTSWYQLPTSISFFQGHGWHVLCRAISSLGEKFATGGPQSFWAKKGTVSLVTAWCDVRMGRVCRNQRVANKDLNGSYEWSCKFAHAFDGERSWSETQGPQAHDVKQANNRLLSSL